MMKKKLQNKRLQNKKLYMTVMTAAFAAGVFFGSGFVSEQTVLAAEASGYFDESGNWVETAPVEITGDAQGIPDASASEEMQDLDGMEAAPEGADGVLASAGDEAAAAGEATAESKASEKTGTYTVASDWIEDGTASTAERKVYKQQTKADQADASTITCGYIDTDFSVLEYEQLRDMLTNNLLYSNVNAQLSSSAVYTDAKDYLYILIVDDSSADYRDIYCYVVGDYRCFTVEIKEYRAEAEELRAQNVKTPQEVGQEIAEGFVWN